MSLLEVYVFFIGICFGSLLNVIILRIPRNESVILPSSKCPQCGNKLKWFHNIPVFSYIALRGKCGFCSSEISIQYPLIEFFFD